MNSRRRLKNDLMASKFKARENGCFDKLCNSQ